MKVRVVELFNQGMRRNRAECRADKGVVGELLLSADGTATLLQTFDHREVEGRRPLARASVMQVTRAGLLVHGLQREIVVGEERWFAQEWWCEPAQKPAQS